MDTSALAGAETQAYVTTDSDSDGDDQEVSCSKPVHQEATTTPSVSINIADAPTLAYEESDEAPQMSYCDEATLAYSKDDDEALDAEISLDDGEAKGTIGLADGVETESGINNNNNFIPFDVTNLNIGVLLKNLILYVS